MRTDFQGQLGGANRSLRVPPPGKSTIRSLILRKERTQTGTNDGAHQRANYQIRLPETCRVIRIC
jgi:hypothetical protein